MIPRALGKPTDGCGCETGQSARELSRFDLIVVGAGSAGVAAAIRGADLGARVALIEGGTLGGTCVNVGCVPSKTLLRAAGARHARKHHGFEGIPRTDGVPQWNRIRAQKDELVERLRQSKYRDVLASYADVTLIREPARLASAESVRLSSGTTLEAPKVILATGASPWIAPIPGLAEAGFLDSTTAMKLEQLPRDMIVIGGSAVGLELAQMFSRLGVTVTVLEAQPHLLPADDPELGDELAGHLAAEGIGIHTGVQITRADRDGRYTVAFTGEVGARELRADQLLVATGRRANTHGLGLEAVGVVTGPLDEIVVDEYLRTTRPSVFAAGDVIGDPMFVYVAASAGALAAENALSTPRPFDRSVVPGVTFTDPAVASVGLTAAAARTRGIEVITASFPMEHVPRALAARDTRGRIKLVADARTRRLLGAHIVAAEAGEMITEPALAIRFGLTIDDLASSLHPYLTLSEGIRLAAQTFNRDVATLSCCAA